MYTPADLAYLREKQVPIPNYTEPENWFLWQAFCYLRTERQTGMDNIGPIPVSAIIAYCRDLYLMTCPVQIASVIRVVVALDNAERT